MSIYTKNLTDNIYFLNDKNIVQDLSSDTNNKLNTIPSLILLKNVQDELSSHTISSVSELKENIDQKTALIERNLGNLSNLTLSLEISADQISSLADRKFVHISGDTIQQLDVINNLSIGKSVKIDGSLRLDGALIQGESTRAIKNCIALGISAEADKSNSFVWNGNDNVEIYQANGEHGTFNINPENGVNGFYIGNQTLSSIINNDISNIRDEFDTKLNSNIQDLSDSFQTKRLLDKIELSNVLSTYTNTKTSELESEFERQQETNKLELSNVLSTYTDQICSAISTVIDNDKYAIASSLSIDYDKNTRNIIIQTNDKFGNITKSELSFDKVTTSQIVDRVEVLTPPQAGIDTPLIRIWWMPKPSPGESQKSTDIPVSDLAQVYVAGDGINITQDLNINVDNTIARTSDLDDLKQKVSTISNDTIPNVENDVSNLKSYIHTLSVDRDSERGILAQISDSIDVNIQDISNLKNKTSELSLYTKSEINNINIDINDIKSFDNMLCTTRATLTGQTVTGVIPDIVNDIEKLSCEVYKSANYAGTISIQKYHPDWIDVGYGNNLSSILKFFNFSNNDKVKNGNLYKIIFIEDTLDFNDVVYAADQSYTTDDGFVLHHNDWIYIASEVDEIDIDIIQLNNTNVHYIQAVHFDEYYQLSNTINATYPWLSGNNTRNVEYAIAIESNGRTPRIITKRGHAFGPNNEFEGNNIFYGKNYFLEERTDFNNISCRNEIITNTSHANNSFVNHQFQGPNLFANINSVLIYNNKFDQNSLSINSRTYINNTLSVNNNVHVTDNLSIDVARNETSIVNLSASRVKADMLSAIDANIIDLYSSNGIIDNLSSILIHAQTANILTSTINVLSTISGTISALESKTINTLSINANEADLAYISSLVCNTDVLCAYNGKIDSLITLQGKIDNLSSVNLSTDFIVNNMLSSNTLTATNISGDIIRSQEAYLCAIQCNDISTSTLSAIESKINKLTTVNLSSNNISSVSAFVPWHNVINPDNNQNLENTFENLSNDISKKIWIKDPTSDNPDYQTGTQSDLSVIKISQEDYNDLVVSNTALDSNILYIVSSDNIDAQSQSILNLGMTNYVDQDNCQILDEATNKHYVDSLVSNVSADLGSNLENELNPIKETFSNLYSTINQLNLAESSELGDIITAINAIKNALSIFN